MMKIMTFFTNTKKLNVWTEREEDGKTYITSGLGFVNRICYYITEVARKEDETITVEDN